VSEASSSSSSSSFQDRPPLELEEPAAPVASGAIGAAADHRPYMPEPLPVRLVAVADVRLPTPLGVEQQLDAFYVGLLQFQHRADALAYQAENFALHFDLTDGPIVHESLRPLGVEVLSLAETEKKLIDAELEYTRQRGLTSGTETLLLIDPAGNWVEIGEVRPVS
jgi:hypothetical protein